MAEPKPQRTGGRFGIGLLDDPITEATSAVATAVTDAITAVPDHLAGRVDATSTESGTAVHMGDHNVISVTAKPSEMIQQEQVVDHSTDDFYSCAYTQGAEEENVSKMITLADGTWDTTNTNGWIMKRIRLPYDFFKDGDFPAHGQTRYFSYLRCGYHFQLMVSAPIGYAGALTIFYAPCELAMRIGSESEQFDRYGLDWATFANLPYAVLDVASNTEATLTVPYINSTNYCKISGRDQAAAPGGVLFVAVLGELEAPQGSSNTIGFTVYGSMIDLDLQGPRCYNQEGRIPVPPRQVPKPPTIPPSTFISPGPGTWNAANSLIGSAGESIAIANEPTAKDYTTAGVRAAEVDLVEVLQRWSLVKTVQWEGNKKHGDEITNFAVDFQFGNFKQICKHFQFFRGSIEVKAVIYCPKSSQGRIQVSWYPTSSRTFNFKAYRNSVYMVTDVGGPAPVLVLPYTAQNWRRNFDRYGTITAHVVNVFRSNSAAANKCTLQFWVRAGFDFKLYCPMRAGSDFDIPSGLGDQPTAPSEDQGITEPVQNDTEPNLFLNFERMNLDLTTRSHSNLKYLFGRAWFQEEYGPNNSATRVALKFPSTGVAGLAHAYIYWTGEFSITVQTGRDPAIFCHSYANLGNHLSLEDVLSAGGVFIPRYSFKTLRIPFYSEQPLRYTYDENSLGFVYISAPSKVYLYLSMTDASFFQKGPLPKVKTRNSALDTAIAPRRQKRCTMGEFVHRVTTTSGDVTGLHWGDKVALTCDNEKFSLPAEEFYKMETIAEIRDAHQDVTLGGDVEENPGPQLVLKHRGIYKHYGVRVGQTVFHTSTENLARSLMNGTVSIVSEPYSDSWKIAGPQTISMAEKYLKAGFLPDFKYSIDNNCESWARSMVDGDAHSYQGSAIKLSFAMMVALGFYTSSMMYENQAGLLGSVTTFLSKITNLIYGGFQCFIVKTVVKTVVKIICYLIMYAHCPNMLTTGVLATLLAIDCMNTQMDPQLKQLIDALVEGKFSRLAKALLATAEVDEEPPKDLDAPPVMENQGPRDFNDWSNVAKNVKWWFENLTHCFTWLKEKIFPPDITELIDELEENKDQIACTLALCDEHICAMMTDKDYATQSQTKEKHQKLVDMLSGILDFLSNLPKTTPLFSRAQSLMHRMQQLSFEPNVDWVTRPEPVGIWISGTAGVGKSFLVTRLVSTLCKHFGWRAYSNPTGSNHMDGYTDQEVHIFDDFGQCRDEDDYSLICQLISPCPFIVPKADVSAKGTPYKAKVVIITTNRHDFSSHKLYDPDALRRRFPIMLKIRPKQNYAVNGRIDISAAMRSGSLMDGSCWERDLKFGFSISTSENWQSLNLKVLQDELIDEIETRARVVRLINQGKDGFFAGLKEKVEKKVERTLRKNLFVSLEQPDSFFDCEKLARTAKAAAINLPNKTKWEKCKFMISECVEKLKKYLDKHRTWIMAVGALGSVLSLASFIIPWGRRRTEQSHYDGNAPVRLTRDFVRAAEKHVTKMHNQGKMDFTVISRRLVEVKDQDDFTATAIPLGSRELITYGHDGFSEAVLGKDISPITKTWDVTVNGEPMDLQIMTVDTNTQFKSLEKLIYDGDYSGNGFLLWKIKGEIYVQPVNNISSFTQFATINGTLSTYCYVYDAKTTVGSCGGVLVAPVNGNLKVLGIHIAGNGHSAVACRLFKFYTNQGKVTSMYLLEKPSYFQPRRTAFKPSPFFTNDHGLEPAVLRRSDPRLEVEIEDVTVKAAQKYVGNTFNPPVACFNAAIAEVTNMLRKVVRKSGSVSYETATDSQFMPIDWKTSPGHKYHGLSKRQLIEDPRYSELFREDVDDQLLSPGTYFTTYLKDELRPISKVKIGKTRAIEACNFDYVVAYRMIMGKIYQQIYDDKACVTGIGVGICPYLHWGDMMRHHFSHALCLDFSGFDGSLPPELMEAAVSILSTFHSNPRQVVDLHKTVIYSKHLVSNQVWEVEGGMCSGSPCTSVLNSICNNLAAVTVALSCGAKLGDFHLVSYGDDLLFTSKEKFDTSKMVTYYKEFFGMTATAADKTENIAWIPIEEAVFLKRTTAFVDFFPMPVGKLDLQSMMDHIQWTKGSFDQQLESFCFELVFHGEKVYDNVCKILNSIDSRVQIPSYFEMQARVKALMYDQGKPSDFGSQDASLACDLSCIQDEPTEEEALALNFYQIACENQKCDIISEDFVEMAEIVEGTASEGREALWRAGMQILDSNPGYKPPSTKYHYATIGENEEENLKALAIWAAKHREVWGEESFEFWLANWVDEHIDLYSQGDLYFDEIRDQVLFEAQQHI